MIVLTEGGSKLLTEKEVKRIATDPKGKTYDFCSKDCMEKFNKEFRKNSK